MRSPSRAAAVLVFVLAGCTLSDEEPEAIGDGVEQGVAAPASRCDGAALDAKRTYHPRRHRDGRVAFANGPLTFAVPAAIPVTHGAAGRGKVTLTFRTGSGPATTCVYRGHDTGSVRGPYRFGRCRPAVDAGADAADDDDAAADDAGDEADSAGDLTAIVAGTLAAADTFTLHVKRGNPHYSVTAVHLDLPGPVDPSACRGDDNFHDRSLAGLGGNGRACADCHMDAQRFQLTPAAAHARFTAMTATGVDDPLFRAIDADDFRTAGAAAQDYTNLIENGLVRVPIPLPPNVRLLDCGAQIPCPASAQPTTETVADVWRAVPPIFDVAITGADPGPVWPRGPNPSGGYQLDGRVDTLEHQALGALRDHAGIAVAPPASWLDDVAQFQRTQFSSPSVAVLAAAIAAATSPLPDPDPVLDPLQAQGKLVFDRACAQCHGNLDDHPSGSSPIRQGTPATPTALVRYHNIFSTCPRPVDTVSPPRFAFAPCSASQLENVRTYQITNTGTPPTGTPCGGPAPQPPCVTRVTTSDPGRLLLTGFPLPGGPGDIEHFDTPSLRGIRLTAPYFINNTAATLEDVVAHYRAFFQRVALIAPAAPLLTTQPGAVPPVHDRPFTDAEVASLLAYLRAL